MVRARLGIDDVSVGWPGLAGFVGVVELVRL